MVGCMLSLCTDFKSEPNIPYAQGCPTSEDNVLCSLAASNSLSNDDIPPATSAGMCTML